MYLLVPINSLVPSQEYAFRARWISSCPLTIKPPVSGNLEKHEDLRSKKQTWWSNWALSHSLFYLHMFNFVLPLGFFLFFVSVLFTLHMFNFVLPLGFFLFFVSVLFTFLLFAFYSALFICLPVTLLFCK